MNITEIEFTAEQAAELVALLQERVDERKRLMIAAEEERAAYALAEKRYLRVQELAREMARMHGPMVGVSSEHQAQVTWDLFAGGDSWFSALDVDDRFDPHDGDEYEQGWSFAYIRALEEEK
jgi:hypothetical protein